MVCLAWAALSVPPIALAKPPEGKGGGGGDKGNVDVCVTLPLPESGAGLESDGLGTYCDDNKAKVQAIITYDGHLDFKPNTGKGDGRTFFAWVDFLGDDPDLGGVFVEGWHLVVGGWRGDFDMRAMGIGDANKRTDVNLFINAYGLDGSVWCIVFDPDWDQWIDAEDFDDSTFATVTRTAVDQWVIEIGEDIESPDQAVLAVNDGEQFYYGGLVTMPTFKVTVELK
jgi:hypothetical protein